MMVVMLILSIVLAAMAPVVTTRSKVDQSSPWRYSEGNLSDAYYGLGESQTAMIGQREFINTDETAKLIINSNSTRPSQIAFKRDGLNQGVLRLENSTTLLGSLNNGSTLGSDSLGIGNDVTSSGSNSVAIGKDAKSTNTSTIAIGNGANASGINSVSIGANSQSQFLSVALGQGARAIGSGNGNSAVGIAIGSNAVSSNTASIAIGVGSEGGGNNSISLGQNSQSSGDYSIAIGMTAKAPDTNSITIGKDAETASDSIAVGYKSSAKDSSNTFGYNSYAYEYSTAIGNNSYATYNSVAIGYNAKANPSDAWSIAIGPGATASNAGGIAIGDSTAQSGSAIAIGSAEAKGSSGIAMGFYAKANGTNNIALGNRACQHVTGSNKVCIGANSGPRYADGTQNSDKTTESLYFGSSGHFKSGATDIDTNGIFELHKKGDYAVAFLNADLVVNGFTWAQVGGKSGHGDAIGFFRSKTWGNQVELYNETRPSFPPASPFSDRRLKYVGKEFTSGLDKIRELKVFNYTFKQDSTKEPRVGVIAQDLQKIFPDAVKKGAEGFLTIRMEDMFYAVINAIKELDTRVTALEKENAELKIRLEKLEAKIK